MDHNGPRTTQRQRLGRPGRRNTQASATLKASGDGTGSWLVVTRQTQQLSILTVGKQRSRLTDIGSCGQATPTAGLTVGRRRCGGQPAQQFRQLAELVVRPLPQVVAQEVVDEGDRFGVAGHQDQARQGSPRPR